jgi:hypothetical protein
MYHVLKKACEAVVVWNQGRRLCCIAVVYHRRPKIMRITSAFDIYGSLHHYLINNTTKVMQLVALVFIIPWKALRNIHDITLVRYDTPHVFFRL